MFLFGAAEIKRGNVRDALKRPDLWYKTLFRLYCHHNTRLMSAQRLCWILIQVPIYNDIINNILFLHLSLNLLFLFLRFWFFLFCLFRARKVKIYQNVRKPEM